MDGFVKLGRTAAVATLLLAGGLCPAAADDARELIGASGVRGGLIVHVGCGDGELTAALRVGEAFGVHGLDRDPRNVAASRERLRKAGLYGPVAVALWRGEALPYITNLVNLLVVDAGADVPEAEALRVLAPGGVAMVRRGRGWRRIVKPRPGAIDEWTHYLHDPSNNAVADDTVVGPPRRYQWVARPRWSRHHDHMSSVSATVSAGGRVFAILDEGPAAIIQLPPRWRLVARDAFNGTLLWKRQVGPWHPHMWPFKSGPAQLPRRLVASGDRVYVTRAIDGPLEALDAATGETVRTYEGTAGTEEVLLSDGVLLLLVRPDPALPTYTPKAAWIATERDRVGKEKARDGRGRRVLAVEARTGKRLWAADSAVDALTLAADADGVYFHDGERIVSLARGDGAVRWRSEPIGRREELWPGYATTLVVRDGVVLFSGLLGKVTAVSAETGERLWRGPQPPSGYYSPEDLLVIDGRVWTAAVTKGGHSGEAVGRNIRTGKVEVRFRPDVRTYWFHHRCHRAKATVNYLLLSRTGIEFVDVRRRSWQIHHWTRGACLLGIMPCNGLVYTPPHPCACYQEAKLHGFGALAPAADKPQAEPAPRRSVGEATVPAAEAARTDAADWPTYRRDAARSGATAAEVPAELAVAWRTPLAGPLSSLTAAGGRVFVAEIDRHAVSALDAETGRLLWRFTAGGRVDSPPTVWRGRVIFGSADGAVTCLSAADGQRIWRFRAAPRDRRMSAWGQIESTHPVHGSVLVRSAGDGEAATVYAVAGRSMFLDGGLRLVRLGAAGGELLGETVLADTAPGTPKGLQAGVRHLNMPVALPDVLSCDGETLGMRSLRLGLDGKRRSGKRRGGGAHLFSPSGLLDGTWFHRSYWIYGRSYASGCSGWFQAGRKAPAGRILVVGPDTVYGYGRKADYFRWTTPVEHELFAAGRDAGLVRRKVGKQTGHTFFHRSPTEPKKAWSRPIGLYARAMVLAGPTLFVAGPPDTIDEEQVYANYPAVAGGKELLAQREAIEGRGGGILLAVRAADGQTLAERELDAPPAWDALIAAGGRLYLATTAGEIVCLKGE